MEIYDISGGYAYQFADFTYLVVKGGRIKQDVAAFFRGIGLDQGSSWSNTSWGPLTLKDIDIHNINASSNECIYLDPHATMTLHNLCIDGCTGRQGASGNYIYTDKLGTLALIVNNTSLPNRSISNGSTGTAPTTANNN